MITSADVLLIAPELTYITGPQWTALIADAYLEMQTGATGWYDMAHLDRGAKYLAAHLAKMTKGKPGLTEAEAVGDVRVQYKHLLGPNFRSALALTTYGLEFLRQMRQLDCRIAVAS